MAISLDTFNGIWDRRHAVHLIKRTSSSLTMENIQLVQNIGLEQTLSQYILKEQTFNTTPLNYYEENDPDVAIGESWVNAKYSSTVGVNPVTHRVRSLKAWIFSYLVNGSLSVHNMMSLFWHNHFPVQETIVPDPKNLYNYYNCLNHFAIGNFKNLTKAITINPTVLIYLNGNSNSKFAPNENYARELLELFTLGIGEQIGPGDYSNYTEHDIKEIAKILTGWQALGSWDNSGVPIHSKFRPGYHDTSTKTLSHYFDYWTTGNKGVDEVNLLLNKIFEQRKIAVFICKKIYRWFVSQEISEEVNTNIIEPLADVLFENDFEILPVLKTLFSSEHFFDTMDDSNSIKNPVQFLVSTIHLMDIQFYVKELKNYEIFENLTRQLVLMQMPLLEPPNVAGWKAYYQEPGFHKLWINSNTIRERLKLTELLSTTSIQVGGHSLVQLKALEFVNHFSFPDQAKEIVSQLYFHFLNQVVDDTQLDCMKSILTDNQPDYTWTEIYNDYLNGVEEMDIEVRIRIGNLINYITSLSKFQLN